MIYVFGVVKLFDCRIKKEVLYILAFVRCWGVFRQQQYWLLKLSSAAKFLTNICVFLKMHIQLFIGIHWSCWWSNDGLLCRMPHRTYQALLIRVPIDKYTWLHLVRCTFHAIEKSANCLPLYQPTHVPLSSDTMKNFEVPIGFPIGLSCDHILGTNFKVISNYFLCCLGQPTSLIFIPFKYAP
jgi:hypothetical protein